MTKKSKQIESDIKEYGHYMLNTGITCGDDGLGLLIMLGTNDEKLAKQRANFLITHLNETIEFPKDLEKI
jgi:hypothetical protein